METPKMDAIRQPFFATFGGRLRRAIAGIMMGLMVMGCAQQPSPIPDGADTRSYGNITAGEKFGVSIGDDFAAAKDTLVGNGYRADGVFSCAKNNGVVFTCASASQEFAPFRLRRLGKDGSVFLVIEEGSVVRIVWSFSFVRVP